MVVIRAIPKPLLIHQASLQRIVSKDIWGSENPGSAIDLSFIRIEPSSRIIRDKNKSEIQLVATLIYDCRNSRPSGVRFCEDDIVVFNGMKHKVQLVEPLYDEKKLHHYEVGLIKHA